MRLLFFCVVPLCAVLSLAGCGQEEGGSPSSSAPDDASDAAVTDMTPTGVDMSGGEDMTSGQADLQQGVDFGQPKDEGIGQGGDQGPGLDMTMSEEDMAKTPKDPWAVKEGYYPAPKDSFELPVKNAKEGLYIKDIQAQFPKVSWKTLDRLYIPAGHYKFIHLGNLPTRDPQSPPLVITNKGGQVKIGGLGHHYAFVLRGGSGWVVSGRYDGLAKTGDAKFPGHRGGAFARSQGTYGFFVDDEFQRDGISGVAVAGGATAFAFEFLEITRVDFAGMLLKTDNTPEAVMQGVELRELYIHDVGSEGIYAGSTQSSAQHQLLDWKVHHNRLLRTGTEALQLGQVAGLTEVHHNVIGPGAIDWRAAFQIYQDGVVQLSQRGGLVSVHHNVILGGGNSLFTILPALIEGDSVKDNKGLVVEKNYIEGTRFLGAYINNVTLKNTTNTFRDNTWRNWQLTRQEVYPKSTMDPGHLIRVSGANRTPLVLERNTWSGPASFVSLLKDPQGNGTTSQVVGKDNLKAQTPAVEFVDSGFPAPFDVLNLEMWTDVATLYERDKGAPAPPVVYPKGKFVTHQGQLYRCLKDPCPAGRVPPMHKDIWGLQPLPSDDVRVKVGSTYETYGLHPPCESGSLTPRPLEHGAFGLGDPALCDVRIATLWVGDEPGELLTAGFDKRGPGGDPVA